MSQGTARQKLLVLLLLILILIVGIFCLTSHDSPMDLLAPVLVMYFVLIPLCQKPQPVWTDDATATPEPYLPAAPDRAPPAKR